MSCRGRPPGGGERFRYSLALSWLRYGILVLFLVALAAHFKPVSNLLAPYSAYGRIVSNLFAPLYLWGNNLLAYFAERADSYAFYQTDVWLKSLPTLLVAAATFIVLVVLAWRGGRTYCNTICPVGTVLGALARYSLFRPVIDERKCNSCTLCARKCKASCIDAARHRIDYSRCVALHGLHRHLQARGHLLPAPGAAPEAGRNGKEGREGGRSACGGSGRSRTPQFPDRRRTAARKRRPARAGEEGGRRSGRDPRQEGTGTPYADRAAGRVALRHMAAHCTGCQLCVSSCPNGVLRPRRTDDPHAARILLRTRLLPPGVRRLLGGLSRRRHS